MMQNGNLKRLIQFELCRCIKNRDFVLSLIISNLICVCDYIFMKKQIYGVSTGSVIQTFVGTDYRFVFNSLFYTLLPIIAAMPHGAIYFEDLKTGYIKNILTKTTRLNYYLAKYISTFVTAFIAVFVPLCLNLILCLTTYPNLLPERLTFTVSAGYGKSFMPILNNLYPVLYIVIYIMLDCLFAGLLTSFCLVISSLVRSKFSAVVTPFAVYIISAPMLAKSYNNFALEYILNPTQPMGNNGVIILLYGVFMLLLGFCLLLTQGLRKEVL